MEETIKFWAVLVFGSVAVAIACAFFGEGDAAITFAIIANLFFKMCESDTQ